MCCMVSQTEKDKEILLNLIREIQCLSERDKRDRIKSVFGQHKWFHTTEKTPLLWQMVDECLIEICLPQTGIDHAKFMRTHETPYLNVADVHQSDVMLLICAKIVGQSYGD